MADSRNLSDDFLLGASFVRLERFAEATACLEKVVGSPQSLPDDLLRKYVPGTLEMQVQITDRVMVRVGFTSVGAALMLAELYQRLNRRSEAIGLIQRLRKIAPSDQAIQLSLADLLYEDNDFEGLVELTEGVENRNDVGLAMLYLKAKALASQGLLAPAIDLMSSCLRREGGRSLSLLREIRYSRAEAYEISGDISNAHRDWAMLVAQDPQYRDVRLRLHETAKSP